MRYTFITILLLFGSLITIFNIVLNIKNAKNEIKKINHNISGIYVIDTISYGIAIALMKYDINWFHVVWPIFIVQILIYYMAYKITIKFFKDNV